MHVHMYTNTQRSVQTHAHTHMCTHVYTAMFVYICECATRTDVYSSPNVELMLAHRLRRWATF